MAAFFLLSSLDDPEFIIEGICAVDFFLRYVLDSFRNEEALEILLWWWWCVMESRWFLSRVSMSCCISNLSRSTVEPLRDLIESNPKFKDEVIAAVAKTLKDVLRSTLTGSEVILWFLIIWCGSVLILSLLKFLFGLVKTSKKTLLSAKFSEIVGPWYEWTNLGELTWLPALDLLKVKFLRTMLVLGLCKLKDSEVLGSDFFR